MKKLILIILSFMLLVGYGKYNEYEIRDEEKSNVVNNIENNSERLKIDSNWNIPVEGNISGIFCGFIDNHSFELLGDDGKYYAISILNLMDEDYSSLESDKSKITIEYIIEEEGSQLSLIKIIDKK